MQTEGRTRVLSLFWNFIVGGVAQYATLLEGVAACAPISLRSFCVLGPKHHVNHALLDKLGDKVVIHRAAPWDMGWVHRLREEIRECQPGVLIPPSPPLRRCARRDNSPIDTPFK